MGDPLPPAVLVPPPTPAPALPPQAWTPPPWLAWLIGALVGGVGAAAPIAAAAEQGHSPVTAAGVLAIIAGVLGGLGVGMGVHSGGTKQ